jgi:hypothetical protein
MFADHGRPTLQARCPEEFWRLARPSGLPRDGLVELEVLERDVDVNPMAVKLASPWLPRN